VPFPDPPSDLQPLPEREPRVSLRAHALAVGSITSGVLARAQAYMFLAAGVLGFAGVVLPHPAQFDVIGLMTLQFLCVSSAGLLLAVGHRLPAWAVAVSPWLGTVLVSLALVFTRDSTSAYTLFYLWIGLYAFYFLPRGRAAALGGFVIANYGVVVLALRFAMPRPHGVAIDDDVHHFVLIAGTLAVAGVFIVLLRERVGRLISQLTDAATTDALTGLLNRRGFQRLMLVELERAKRSNRPFSLLTADCDHFKLINDRFGHGAGDQALQRIGSMLESHKRSIDTAARIGGEEFALILPETDQHEAYIVAERLRNRLSEVFESEALPLKLSFGVASFPVHGSSSESLMRAADEALYAAKALGRDRTVLHSAEVQGILSDAAAPGSRRDHARLATVLGLAEALDLRDSGTARHSQTVGRYSQFMARELELPAEQVERVRLAGVLHDIGKIGVPDSILRKPGRLTDEEMEQMRKHPEIGARILGGAELNDIRSWILAHHERPDGQGYPRGLGAEDIPLEAKILAVADSYEAMTSDRVYRRAIGREAARAELQRWGGAQFDQRVVDAFLAVLDRAGGVEDPVEHGFDRN
jgi:diguanylate cyclase (GGDEF)-like protein/putative nucleotidyltransferase with HDIG domain